MKIIPRGERTQREKDLRKVSQRLRAQTKRKFLLHYFGDTCKVCKFESRITVHRKDGTSHKDFRNMSWKELNTVVTADSDKYVSMCHKCHKHVHWCMKVIRMNWDDIESRMTGNAEAPGSIPGRDIGRVV